MRILSIAYGNIEQAPKLLSVSSVSSKTSLQVSAELSSTGSVYCAVYGAAATTSVPSSVNSVLLQNLVASTNAANVSTVLIQGLDAASWYNVYFLTVSPIGVRSTIDDVLASVRVLNTSCCKTVTATLAAGSVLENTAAMNILSIALSAKPSDTLRVSIQLYVVSAFTGISSLYSQTMFPALFVVNSATASASSVLQASLPALPNGFYSYNVVLSGDSASEYTVVYTNNQQQLQVLSANAEPPVPALTQAVFAKDGSYVSISFSTSTNRGSTATSFLCSALFDFACASTSNCQWTDSSTVLAYVQVPSSPALGASCAGVHSTLKLLATAVVKAKCQAPNDNGNGDACPTYSTWKTAASTSVLIQRPASPVSPSVAISAPSVIGSCDDFSLDVSGSSGSGGRPWSNASISVLGMPGTNVSAISN